MIFFDLAKRQKLLDEHYTGLENIVIRRINSTTLAPTIKKFVRGYIKEILIGDVDELEFLNNKLKRNSEYKNDKGSAKEELKKIFNYDLFINKTKRYDAYDLAKGLGVRTCLYCNRLYTLTVVKKNNKYKFTRPEFDHFLDKDNNPLLALSIYNLIPSCKVCNSSLKGTKPFSIRKHLHPYKDDCMEDYWYRFLPHNVDDVLKGNSSLKVSIDTALIDQDRRQRIKRTSNVFKLNEIFSAHTEELSDLFEIRHLFSKEYFRELKKTYEHLKLSDEDYYRIIFGTYYKKEDFHRRPFSKIKYDLLKELNVINNI